VSDTSVGVSGISEDQMLADEFVNMLSHLELQTRFFLSKCQSCFSAVTTQMLL